MAYFWTISTYTNGTHTVKARTYFEACEKLGFDPMKCRLTGRANA